MKLDITTLEGGSAGSIELSDAIFGLEPRADILARMVRYQLAKRRAGTHKSKGRSEVDRSRKKIYKQKGTGNARHGDRKVNLMKGGGHAHSKKRVREDYRLDMPKKMRRKANRNALLAKLVDNEVRIIDDLAFAAPKTKDVVTFLEAIKVDKTALLAISASSGHTRRAAQNVEQVTLTRPDQLTAFDMLNHRFLVISKADLQAWLTGPSSQTGKSAKVSPMGAAKSENN